MKNQSENRVAEEISKTAFLTRLGLSSLLYDALFSSFGPCWAPFGSPGAPIWAPKTPAEAGGREIESLQNHPREPQDPPRPLLD